MSLDGAVRSVLRQCARFGGRARRSEYWMWILAQVILYAILVAIGFAEFVVYEVLFFVALFGLLVPNWAVASRRLHDTGRSGWIHLIAILPVVGGIALLVLLCQDSQPDNEYGPSPKGYGQFAQYTGAGYPPAP